MKWHIILLVAIILTTSCLNNQTTHDNENETEILGENPTITNETLEIPQNIEPNSTLQDLDAEAEQLRLINEIEYQIQLAKNTLGLADNKYDDKKSSMSKTEKEKVESYMNEASNLIFQAEENMADENYEVALELAKRARRAAINAERII